jgi:serine/threonine protein kinase
MTLSAGTRLGHYEIRSLLGAGGMGEVYLAHDLMLKRTVAMKVLSAEFAGDRQRMSRFTQEARIASLLNHPNTIHVYEIGQAEGINFIAMEYVEGQPLRRTLAQSRLNLALALDIAAQVAGALAAAHSIGVIHRDIKAENIMVGRDGHVKILDFGLAKPAPTDSTGAASPKDSTVSRVNTSPGVVMGTVAYMSPEQARGLEVDARTDIWSLGVVLYEMLTGQTPFDGPTANDVIASILKQEPPPPSRFREGLPEALEWVVMKALVKDVEGRYQTAREFLADIQKLKQRYGPSAEGKLSAEDGHAHAAAADGRNATTGEAGGLTSANSTAHQTSSVAYIV